MDMGLYCKQKGFSKEEYKTFKENIKSIAAAIVMQLKDTKGLYYPTSNIIHYQTDKNIKHFIIEELKELQVEFKDNNKYYRY